MSEEAGKTYCSSWVVLRKSRRLELRRGRRDKLHLKDVLCIFILGNAIWGHRCSNGLCPNSLHVLKASNLDATMEPKQM